MHARDLARIKTQAGDAVAAIEGCCFETVWNKTDGLPLSQILANPCSGLPCLPIGERSKVGKILEMWTEPENKIYWPLNFIDHPLLLINHPHGLTVSL